jgi:hypothetical protein
MHGHSAIHVFEIIEDSEYHRFYEDESDTLAMAYAYHFRVV